MESNPSRAKRLISSRPSQGFFSRFRRSTLSAFVSWSGSAIKRKTHRQPSLAMGCLEYAETKKFLGQQPPSARRHGCATTTHITASPVLLVLSKQHSRDPKHFDIGWSNLDSNFRCTDRARLCQPSLPD